MSTGEYVMTITINISITTQMVYAVMPLGLIGALSIITLINIKANNVSETIKE